MPVQRENPTGAARCSSVAPLPPPVPQYRRLFPSRRLATSIGVGLGAFLCQVLHSLDLFEVGWDSASESCCAAHWFLSYWLTTMIDNGVTDIDFTLTWLTFICSVAAVERFCFKLSASFIYQVALLLQYLKPVGGVFLGRFQAG